MYLLKIILFLFLLTSTLTRANDNLKVGTSWTYTKGGEDLTGEFDYYDQCLTFEVISHELRNDTLSAKIEIRECDGNNLFAIDYIFTSGDSTFYYNYDLEHFVLLYDFSKQVGDVVSVHSSSFTPNTSWLSPEISISKFEYEITEVGDTLVDGVSLKYQKVDLNDYTNGEWFFFNPYIFQEIGGTGYMYGIYTPIIPESVQSSLRCFSNSEIDFHTEEKWKNNCEEVVGLSDYNKMNINPTIYPNPFHTQLHVEVTSNEVQIHDLLGNQIYTGEPGLINMEDQADGMYIVSWEEEGGLKTEKVVLSK